MTRTRTRWCSLATGRELLVAHGNGYTSWIGVLKDGHLALLDCFGLLGVTEGTGLTEGLDPLGVAGMVSDANHHSQRDEVGHRVSMPFIKENTRPLTCNTLFNMERYLFHVAVMRDMAGFQTTSPS